MGLDGSLAAEERRQTLLDQLRDLGRVDIAGAADQLDVSPMTIRRDLRGLEGEGLARLVRGGAVPVGIQEFAVRQSRALTAKRRIAEKLGTVVTGHESIAVDGSTTVFRFVEELHPVADLLVVTYGIPAFQVLQSRDHVRAFLSGGELEPRTGSLLGPVAQRTIDSFSVSCSVLSTMALDPEVGTMEPTVEEVEMKRALLRSGQYTVLAVDATKLGQRSAVRSIAVEEVDLIVTELDPTDARLDPYRERVELL